MGVQMTFGDRTPSSFNKNKKCLIYKLPLKALLRGVSDITHIQKVLSNANVQWNRLDEVIPVDISFP